MTTLQSKRSPVIYLIAKEVPELLVHRNPEVSDYVDEYIIRPVAVYSESADFKITIYKLYSASLRAVSIIFEISSKFINFIFKLDLLSQ